VTSTTRRSKTVRSPSSSSRLGELADWWRFWRGGKHTKYSIQRALETAYDLELLDARWFLDTLESGGGKLHGTDVLVEGMSKTELADWIKKIHESGDGSPRGLLNALGWPTLVAKTSNAVLLSAMDAFAQKNGLVKDKFKADEGEPDGRRGSTPPSRPSGWSEGKSLAPKESPSSRDVGSGREAKAGGKRGPRGPAGAPDALHGKTSSFAPTRRFSASSKPVASDEGTGWKIRSTCRRAKRSMISTWS
jgi:hypothetical protein